MTASHQSVSAEGSPVILFADPILQADIKIKSSMI
jgi:hypothetical protein